MPALRRGESPPRRRRRVQRVHSARRGGGTHRRHRLRPLRRLRPRGVGLQHAVAEGAVHRPDPPLRRPLRQVLRRGRNDGQGQDPVWLLPDQHRLVVHLLGAAAGQVHGLDRQAGQRGLHRLVGLLLAGAVPRLWYAARRQRSLPRRPHRPAHGNGNRAAAPPLACRVTAPKAVGGGGPRPPRPHARRLGAHFLLRALHQRLHLPLVVVSGASSR